MNYEAQKAHEAWMQYAKEAQKTQAAVRQQENAVAEKKLDKILQAQALEKEKENPLLQTAEFAKARSDLLASAPSAIVNAYNSGDVNTTRAINSQILGRIAGPLIGKEESRYQTGVALKREDIHAKPDAEKYIADVGKISQEEHDASQERLEKERSSSREEVAKVQFGVSNEMNNLLINHLKKNPELLKSLLTGRRPEDVQEGTGVNVVLQNQEDSAMPEDVVDLEPVTKKKKRVPLLLFDETALDIEGKRDNKTPNLGVWS